MVIFVRTYKRYDQVKTHTLKFLEDNNLLQDTILLVANEEEYDLYRESLRESLHLLKDIWITSLGGGRSYDVALSRIPEGERVFLIDDDIQYLKEHPTGENSNNKMLNLKEYLEYGFRACENYSVGMFGFDWSNIFFKQGRGFAIIGTRRISGGFWGGLNCKEFVTGFDHEDDNVRSAQVLERYGKTLTFNWIGCKLAPIGTNPGGMQADGSRGDKTYEKCSAALKNESVLKFFEPEPKYLESYKVYSLKPIHRSKLKKMPYFVPDVVIDSYFGGIPSESGSLEDFL